MNTWASSKRPLKSLTKEQLFKYIKADPSPEAEWDFSKEVIARNAAYLTLEAEVINADNDVTRLQYRLAQVEINLSKEKAKDPQDLDLKRIAERAVKATQEAIQKAMDRASELKRRVRESMGRDDVISQKEIADYYRTRYMADWNIILQDYKDGTLLMAQRLGFASFLAVKRGQKIDDTMAYWKAEGLAKMVNEEHNPHFLNMQAMFYTRVMPALADRREFTDGEAGGTVTVAGLKPDKRAKYWRWWRAYNLATIQHGWIDCDIDIHDLRNFDPNASEIGAMPE